VYNKGKRSTREKKREKEMKKVHRNEKHAHNHP